MSELVYRDGARGTEALATGKWADEQELSRLQYRDGQFWLGYAPTQSHFPLGYDDDRHICQVAGSRGGKGTTSIINNLCLWPGSVVVVDPKGENATVTARRRGNGSDYAQGMGQAVHILDPFGSVDNAEEYRARFNPLDAIDPNDEEAVDEAGRIADAIVVVQEKGGSDPFWDESARSFVRGVILHVITDPFYESRRNLITVRQLIARGDWESVETLQAAGEEEIPSPYELLFEGMRRNERFDGVISGTGNSFGSMAVNSPKTFESVIQVANRNTEFIDSPGMRRCLEASDFAISDLKTDPKGVSLYLSLPQRYMSTHYRWLRMMIALTITEMEKVRRQPASGHRVLMVLDEFAGLKRMEVIENAAAQIAGYGVKMWFVLQTLGQLKDIYKENWQTFLANSGLQLFAQVDDEFTKKYVSDALGETELTRKTQSFTHSSGTSSGTSYGGGGTGFLASMIPGTQSGTQSGTSSGWSEAIHKTHLLSPNEVGKAFARVNDDTHPAYPGISLALVPGRNPAIVHRSNYFEDPKFQSLFDPHPDHPAPPTLAELEARALARKQQEEERNRRDQLEAERKSLENEKAVRKVKTLAIASAMASLYGITMVMLDRAYYFLGPNDLLLGYSMMAGMFGGPVVFVGSLVYMGILQNRSPASQLPHMAKAIGNSHHTTSSQATSDAERAVLQNLEASRDLQAIKDYRAMTGCSLKEARHDIKEKYGYDV